MSDFSAAIAGLKASDAVLLGRLVILQDAVAQLIATHPRKAQIIESLNGVSDGLASQIASRSGDPVYEDFATGAAKACEEIAERSRS